MARKEETYKRAMSQLMSRLLFSYLRKDVDWSSKKDGCWRMAITEKVPEGALVVPYAIMDAKEWWMGWYRGKSEDGYDLIESVETHRLCKFGNIGLLFLDNLEFADSPLYRYSDREYDIIDTIERRVAKNNYWFVVGNPTFHEDGNIDIPIRKKFTDDFLTKTYKNIRACTIAALDEHWYRIKPLDLKEEIAWEFKHFPNTWRESMLFASKEDCVYSLLND